VPLAATAHIQLPFAVGSSWSKAKRLEVVVEKGHELALTPMTLRIDPLHPKPPVKEYCEPAELVFIDGGRVVVRVDTCDVGDIIAAPGTVWRPHGRKPVRRPGHELGDDAHEPDKEWQLTEPRSAVSITVGEGEMRKATLSFTAPATLKPGTRTQVRIYQRNDRRVITGSVILELQVADTAGAAKTGGAIQVRRRPPAHARKARRGARRASRK
jgi:hypothetical protein